MLTSPSYFSWLEHLVLQFIIGQAIEPMKTSYSKTATLIFTGLLSFQAAQAQPALKTKPLTLEGDIASHLVAGVDRFLLRELSASITRREQHWSRDFTSHAAYAKSVEPNRQRLAHIIGLRDQRVAFDGLTLGSTTAESSLVGQTDRITVRSVSWPAFGDVTATGLLLEPMYFSMQ